MPLNNGCALIKFDSNFETNYFWNLIKTILKKVEQVFFVLHYEVLDNVKNGKNYCNDYVQVLEF